MKKISNSFFYLVFLSMQQDEKVEKAICHLTEKGEAFRLDSIYLVALLSDADIVGSTCGSGR